MRRWRCFDGLGFPSCSIRALYPFCGIFVDKESFASFHYLGQETGLFVIELVEIWFHVRKVLLIPGWLFPRDYVEAGFLFD